MSAGRTALGFVGLALLVSLGLAAIGYVPTRRWGGEPAVEAMFAGCGIGFFSAALAGIPIAFVRGAETQQRAMVAFGAMGVRLVVALALGATAAWSGLFAKEPLLLWLGISYVALLSVETTYAIKALGGERS